MFIADNLFLYDVVVELLHVVENLRRPAMASCISCLLMNVQQAAPCESAATCPARCPAAASASTRYDEWISEGRGENSDGMVDVLRTVLDRIRGSNESASDMASHRR